MINSCNVKLQQRHLADIYEKLVHSMPITMQCGWKHRNNPTLTANNSGLKPSKLKNYHIFRLHRTSAFSWYPPFRSNIWNSPLNQPSKKKNKWHLEGKKIHPGKIPLYTKAANRSLTNNFQSEQIDEAGEGQFPRYWGLKELPGWEAERAVIIHSTVLHPSVQSRDVKRVFSFSGASPITNMFKLPLP